MFKRPEVMRTNCTNHGVTALFAVDFFAERVVFLRELLTDMTDEHTNAGYYILLGA